MNRAVDFLLKKNRLVSNISSLALVLLVVALIVIGLVGVVGLDQAQNQSHPISLLVGMLLGAVLILALVAMVSASWQVLKHRREVLDWGVFLAIVWLIPYIGISVYLGGKNLLRR